MPGAYAHITLVNIRKEPQTLEAITGFPEEAISAVLDYFKYCELGAVSPDYPYLAVGDSAAARWADAMHYTRTGQTIHAGVKQLQRMRGEPRRKGLSWLLGYSAHVATDVTIHPVVEQKVGPYAQNKKDHRICEMNQDAHIFQRLNLGGIGLSEHLDSGILACGVPGDRSRMDSDIVTLWNAMLQAVHPREFAENPPAPHTWHSRFGLMVDKIAEEGNRLLPIARHVAVEQGLTYPTQNEIDPQFIKQLGVPGGQRDYDDIFMDAVRNVGSVWNMVARGVLAEDRTYLAGIGDWDLDTGKDGAGKFVFWG